MPCLGRGGWNCIAGQRTTGCSTGDCAHGVFSSQPPFSFSQVGADLCMGSLIKNPGGTLVPGGGYVAGKRHLVDAALARLTAPGIGSEAGAVNGETLRLMFQGGSLGGVGGGAERATSLPWLGVWVVHVGCMAFASGG